MRRILVSSLFLSTVLLPAQTVTNGQVATLIARNDSAPAVAASDISTVPTRRITTGVTAPKLLSTPVVRVSLSDFPTTDLATQKMIVSFRVDEKGIPQNVHLLKSINQSVDGRVLAAVREYRFEPATLDEQAVPMDVNLAVNFSAR
jgi:TonB family protein